MQSDALDILKNAKRGTLHLTDPENDAEIDGEKLREVNNPDVTENDYFYYQQVLVDFPAKYRDRQCVNPGIVSIY